MSVSVRWLKTILPNGSISRQRTPGRPRETVERRRAGRARHRHGGLPRRRCEIFPYGLGGSPRRQAPRSEEHTSELQSLMRISYAVFCLKKKTNNNKYQTI